MNDIRFGEAGGVGEQAGTHGLLLQVFLKSKTKTKRFKGDAFSILEQKGDLPRVRFHPGI